MPSRAITEVNTPVGALMGSITNLDNRLRIVEKREVSGGSSGGGATVIHSHINPDSGGVIDYLRTQWGTDHTNPANDPHTQYLTQARGDTRYALIAHNHNAAYAALGTTITAGAGLTGGGDLSANRTLNVGAGTGIVVAADTVALDTAFSDGRYALTSHNHDPVYVNVTGDAMTGDLTITNPSGTGGLYLNGSPASGPRIGLRANGLDRWQTFFFGNETGSNAGSDYFIFRYNDAGNQLTSTGTPYGAALHIARATGATAIGGTVTVQAPAGSAGFLSYVGGTLRIYQDTSNFLPGTDVSMNLGDPTHRWIGVNARDAFFDSISIGGANIDDRYVNITGDTMTGALIVNSDITGWGTLYLQGTPARLMSVNAPLRLNTNSGDLIFERGGGQVGRFRAADNWFEATYGAQILSTLKATRLEIDNGAADSYGPVVMRNGLNRWYFGYTGAETGSNAGTNFSLTRNDDAGNSLGIALLIERANGNVTLAGRLYANGGLNASDPNISGIVSVYGATAALNLSDQDGSGYWSLYDLNDTLRFRTNGVDRVTFGPTGTATFAGNVTVTPPSGQRALTGNGDFGLLELAATNTGIDLYIGSTRHYLMRDSGFWPDTNYGKTLGLPTNRFSTIYGNILDVNQVLIAGQDIEARYVNTAGDTMTGALTNQAWIITPSVYFDGAAGTARGAIFTTSTARRWTVETDTGAETGSNAGSNLRIVRYSDAAAVLGDALTINRASGASVFGGNLTVTPPGYLRAGAIRLTDPQAGGQNTYEWYYVTGADTLGFRFGTDAGGYTATGISFGYGGGITGTTIHGTTAVQSAGRTIQASPDAGNTIQFRANGFYATAGAIQISADPDNILEVKPDGLFVRKGLLFGK